MIRVRKPNLVKTIAPDKQILTLDDLPPRDNIRWNNRLKQIVVSAVESGLISLWDASDRYRLSVEEYFTWKRASKWAAAPARRATRAKTHRQFQFKQAA
jgi:hypothetical protein